MPGCLRRFNIWWILGWRRGLHAGRGVDGTVNKATGRAKHRRQPEDDQVQEERAADAKA